MVVTRREYRREPPAHSPRRESFADRKQPTRALRTSPRYVRTMLGTGAFDVVLPVLDEALALPVVLADLPPQAIPLVVDNGSTDGSAAIARELGARVVMEPRRGFGAACWSGLRAATSEVVCFMDCDGSFRGADLVEVAAPVLDGSADLVLGARLGTTGWPLHARWANRAIAFELRRRTGIRFADLGPMRARCDEKRCSVSASPTAVRVGPSRWCSARPMRVGGSRSDRSATRRASDDRR